MGNTRQPAWTSMPRARFTKGWSRRRSKSQPYVRLQVKIQREDYNHFGFPLRVLQARSFVSAIADTDCQSCLAGHQDHQETWRLSTGPHPCQHQDASTKQRQHQHPGCPPILRLSGKDNEGEERSTRQMVYVTNNIGKLFLSREACVDLGIIPKTFPTIGETETNRIGQPRQYHGHPHTTTGMSVPQANKASPPFPTSLPLPTIETNREKLQQYLLDHYASSTFNTW